MTEHHNPIDAEPPTLPALVDELDALVTHARAMPMSASVLVNRADALALVDDLRAAMPAQLDRADEVLSDADRVLAEAEEQSERVIATARTRAAQLVAEEQVVVQARAEAARIVEDAHAQADALRRDADDYCDRRLAEFEIDLGKLVQQVQAGRAKLADRLDDGASSTSD
ncbi:ATP synthase F0 subunit B [Sanguibacter sp. A247]|uniref:ATP synthase F0 subunit B n=1 Tax=unclassified Sanguibacter TaxID=2645534 RepID=UPI003FD8543C